MRLLNVNNIEFREFRDDQCPKYVIASHRWVEGAEATLQDVTNRKNTNKSGYKKIVEFAKYVQEHVPDVEWLWVDTCCIDKDSAAELSKSLNLMFSWYRNAVLCIAYLMDVKEADNKSALERSEWFKRGWTLQELLAPRLIIFVTETWQVIGNKGASSYLKSEPHFGPGLEESIAAITGIPKQVLYDYAASSSFSVEEKLRWMEGRKTTEPEDMHYALYGIFGVRPGANYGEGHEGAKQRLLAAIHHQDNLATQQAERFQKIAAWLSPPNPWINYESARQLHEPQTGAWLLESNQYQSWKATSIRHLWMSGKAGCGKTVLCSTAIEDMRAYCEHQPRLGYAIFYFSFSDDRKQRHADLLCSLVAQLGWKGPALSMLQQAYDKPNRSILGTDELEKILLLCFHSYDTVFLFLDALDECPEESDIRHSMLECLARLSQKAANLKIFATSRELPDIRESTGKLDAMPMKIATNAVDRDIQQFIVTQLSRDHRLARLDQKTKTLIEETISAKADGMFRWAYCQLQELKKLKASKPKYIKELLCHLPATLDATYERMLSRIEEMFRKEALVLLQWLAYAQSPPSLGELAEAAIIDLARVGSVEVDERGAIEDTLEILSGLIVVQANTIQDDEWDNEGSEVDDDNTTEYLDHDQSVSDSTSIGTHYPRFRYETKVRLAHFSVKEYLESERILQSGVKEFYLESAAGHRLLAQSCLTYIMHYSSSDEKAATEQDLTTFPLLRYAARTWYYHSSLQRSEDVEREMCLLSSKDAKEDWLLVYNPDRWNSFSLERRKDLGSGLYYASFTGLEAVVGRFLKHGVKVNGQGGHFGNALQAASAGGYEKVVQMLIDAGADINAQGGYYGTALQAASAFGYEKIVQMLIDAGADINAQGGRYGNALQAASARGDEKVVQMLIDAGADVNAQGGEDSNALQAARGHETVVQKLIDAGADINAQGGHYGNALQAALAYGHEKVVQMLIDAGADINAQGGHYGNALQAASARGYEEIVQMLIDAGADINAQGGWYGNALQAASAGGDETVVQMLIDAGADINAQGGHYGNALQAASAGGDEKIVQMLIDAGADINARGGNYGNALQAASARGYEKVVQMLIDAGADINAQGGRYGNALQAASALGYEKVVQMLIDAGADINAQGGEYSNALQAALAYGHEKVVQMLIDAGADINAQGGFFGNALQAASARANEKIVQKLIDAGADVNAQGGEYSNALQAASARGYEKVVQMLLDAGAQTATK